MSVINIQNMTIDIPDNYQLLNSLPGDPEGSIPIGLQTRQSEDFALLIPIKNKDFMQLGDLDELINKTRRSVGEAFGLVAVGEGTTDQGLQYIYRILKVKMNPHGVQYQLTMQLINNNQGIQISGYFDEIGTTGIRDVMVFEILRREGKVNEDMESWTADPYDPSVKTGFLMNISEREQYDEIFPDHPLSVVRSLIRHLTGKKDIDSIKKAS